MKDDAAQQYSTRQHTKRTETVTSQSVQMLPALNTESRRDSKVETGLSALGKWASQENSRERLKEKDEKLSKKISQYSFEDIYLHS